MRKSLSGRRALAVTILGSGDAFASRGRFQSGYVIEAQGCRILMEAGPTVLCAMKRMGFAPADFDLILISHLHGDHFGGLPFLILEYLYESRLDKTLTIAGPRRLEERTWRLFRTMFPASDAASVARRLRFVVLEPARTVRLAKIELSTLRTPHMKRDYSLAFRLVLDGKTIVFTGDSGWTDKLPPFAAGADLCLCECTYFESSQLDFHINYPLLAAKRDLFDVGRMVLTHVGREVIDRAKQIRMETAFDGMKIRV
jgi:ribonuclease BN (tRNA processing enzyme)